MTVEQLLADVSEAGGSVLLRDDKLVAIDVPDWLVTHLRGHRDALYALLHERQRTSFPRCPKCLSYYLYRDHGVGNFECMSCELQDIPEVVARSVPESIVRSRQ